MVASQIGRRSGVRSFVQLWWWGYVRPARMLDGLRGQPAPLWGLAAQGTRALLDGLLLYLPLALLGRAPSTPPYLTFISAETYYAWAVVIMPVFLVGQWLLLVAAVHVLLRLMRYPGDFDRLLNLTGMIALVVGALILVWDWLYVLLGGQSDVFLGISHLVINVWGIALLVAGLRQHLGLPVRVAVSVSVAWVALGIPLALIFARAPV